MIETGIGRRKVGEQLRSFGETPCQTQDAVARFVHGAFPEIEMEPHENIIFRDDRSAAGERAQRATTGDQTGIKSDRIGSQTCQTHCKSSERRRDFHPLEAPGHEMLELPA